MNRHVARGNRDFAAGKYEEAEISYLRSIRVGGMNPVAVRQLGFLYYEQGRVPNALRYLHKAAELEPENIDVQRKLGAAYFGLRHFKEASEAAARVLARQPDDEDALLLLADSVQNTNELQQARQTIEKLRQTGNDKAGYHVALGNLLFRQRDFANAQREYETALKLDPQSTAAHAAIGTLYWLRNDLNQAEQAFKTASELAPLRSARHLKWADFKLKTGGVEEAKKALEEVTRKAPDYVPAWSYLIQVAFAERRFEDCAALIKKVLQLDPLNYDAMLTSGRLHLAQKDADKAVNEFTRMTSVYGDRPHVHYHLALARLLKNDVNEAVNSLNQALSRDRNFTDATLLLAELDIRKNDLSAAIRSLAEVIKQNPYNVKGHLLLANAYERQGALDDAAAVYRNMTSLFPRSAETSASLGSILVKQKKLGEARQAFEKALELSPGYAPATEQLVFLDLAEKQPALAMQRVKSFLEKNPKSAPAWLWLAGVHFSRGENDEAEAAMLKALEINPDERNAYLMLSQLYIAQKKNDRALDKLKAYVAKTNDAAALLLIANLHESAKNFGAARDVYERILSFEPDAQIALNNLAYIYTERFPKLDRAAELAERSRKLSPSDPAAADTLGWVFFKQGQYLKALSLIQESAAKLASAPEVIFHLGMTHYMLGQEEAARTNLQNVVATAADFPGKDEARRRLELIAIDAQTAGPDVLRQLEQAHNKEPGDPIVLKRLALAYERSGKIDNAIPAYEQLLRQNPRNMVALTKLAGHYDVHLKKPAQALAHLKAAHEIAPDDAYVSHRLAALVYRMGDYRQFAWALSLLQEAARKVPDDPAMLFDLALMHYALGHVTEAEDATKRALLVASASFRRSADARQFLEMIALWRTPSEVQQAAGRAQQILAEKPDFVPALMVSAFCNQQKGDFKAAMTTYEAVLARNPLFGPALRELALLYAKHVPTDPKGYDVVMKARQQYSTDPDIARALAVLAYHRGDFKRAVETLKGITMSSRDGESFYYLGMAYYRLQQTKESKEALQRALAMNIAGKFAEEANRVISELK